MDTRTYRAFTMAQALAAVRKDLGSDAVVLTTRAFKRGGFLGLGRRTIVEVTASRNTGQKKAQQHRQPAPPASRSPRQSQAAQAYNGTSKSAEVADASQRRQQLAVELLDELQRREAETGTAKRNETPASPRAAEGRAVSSSPAPRSAHKPKRSSEALRGGQQPAPRAPRSDATRRADSKSVAVPETVAVASDAAVAEARSEAPVARRFVLAGDRPAQPAHADHVQQQTPSIRPAATASTASRADAAPAADAMQRELAAIRSMVGRVLHATGTDAAIRYPDVPEQLFETYLHLISQDLSEDIADQIINSVKAELSAEQLSDAACVQSTVASHLARCIPVAECPVALESPDDRPLTIALVGPTGVGKTTTLAKLAASFKLRHEKRVGLITCDTYRIAAVDQLRTYANIIGLPLEVVLTPSEMPRAMHALRECDVVLIDTAGRSQRDTDRLVELREFLAQAQPHEIHLVLSSTASEKVLLQEAQAFSSVGADKVVLTKLDEAVSFGMLVNVIRRIGRELSFFTTGQEVPDHIEIGRADRLAALMLAAE